MSTNVEALRNAVDVLERHTEQLPLGELDNKCRRSLASRLNRLAKIIDAPPDCPPRDLRKACKHLEYEIDMLFRQGKEFLQLERLKKQKAKAGTITQSLLNALNEAFFVHARILDTFLYRSTKWSDEMVAKHYWGPWHSKRPKEPDVLGGTPPLRDRINKHILHLTYNRIALRERRHWPVRQLMDAMRAPLQEFCRQVDNHAPGKLSEALRKVINDHCGQDK